MRQLMEKEPLKPVLFPLEEFDPRHFQRSEQVLDLAHRIKSFVVEHYPSKLDVPEITHLLSYCDSAIREKGNINTAEGFYAILERAKRALDE